jgi:hypothetical protein
MYCYVYVYVFLLVLSVLPPSGNSIAVNNNNNNNNKAIGTISKSFRKYVSTIPGNYGVKELQKTAILGTAHIRVLRKVLM